MLAVGELLLIQSTGKKFYFLPEKCEKFQPEKVLVMKLYTNENMS